MSIYLFILYDFYRGHTNSYDNDPSLDCVAGPVNVVGSASSIAKEFAGSISGFGILFHHLSVTGERMNIEL